MIGTAIGKLLSETVDDGVRVKPSTDTVKISAATLPTVVYSLLYKTRRYTDQGSVKLTQARLQVDVFAASMSAAEAIADQITADAADGGLDGYAGAVSAGNSETVIERIYFNDGDAFTASERIEGEQNSIARWSVDLIAEYRGN